MYSVNALIVSALQRKRQTHAPRGFCLSGSHVCLDVWPDSTVLRGPGLADYAVRSCLSSHACSDSSRVPVSSVKNQGVTVMVYPFGCQRYISSAGECQVWVLAGYPIVRPKQAIIRLSLGRLIDFGSIWLSQIAFTTYTPSSHHTHRPTSHRLRLRPTSARERVIEGCVLSLRSADTSFCRLRFVGPLSPN